MTVIEAAITRVLSDSLTTRGVEQCRAAPNRLLSGRVPVEVLREGDADAVLRAATGFVEGVYV